LIERHNRGGRPVGNSFEHHFIGRIPQQRPRKIRRPESGLSLKGLVETTEGVATQFGMAFVVQPG
jgi:hypothetical protein